MSIIAFVGLPGSGKSYNVVSRVILPALRSGREIVTNIPLQNLADFDNPKVTYFDIEKLKDDVEFFQNIKAGAVYIFDEAQLLWAAGLKAHMINDLHKKFFSMHRHMVGESGLSTEIVLVTQDLSNIANFFRQLVETTYRSSKLSVVGASNRFKLEVYSGFVTGNKPSKQHLLNTFTGVYDKKVYRYYKSNTMAKDSIVSVKELRSDGNPSIFKTKKFIFIAIFAPLSLIYGIYNTVQFFNPETSDLVIKKQSDKSDSSQSLTDIPSSSQSSSDAVSKTSIKRSSSHDSVNGDADVPPRVLSLLKRQYGFIPDGFAFQPVYLSGYIQYGTQSVLMFDYQGYSISAPAVCNFKYCRILGAGISINLDHQFVLEPVKEDSGASFSSLANAVPDAVNAVPSVVSERSE